jgi:hypothetical protein
MAGRGTDIQLGGNVEFRIEDELADMPEARARRAIAEIKEEVAVQKQRVIDAGGLFVLGTERHEAAASTTSCAAARAARAIPASAASTSASTTICCASSVRRPCSRA